MCSSAYTTFSHTPAYIPSRARVRGQLFAMYEDERLKKAAAAKEAAMRSRQNAVRAKEAMIRDRQAAAVRQDRVNEARATASKEAVMRDNQSKRRTVFGGRYAPREAAILFERSAFKKCAGCRTHAALREIISCIGCLVSHACRSPPFAAGDA